MTRTLPAIRARLNLRVLEQAAEVISFNLRRAAVSVHESAFAPHCVAAVDGVVYAAGPGGIYAYTGTLDGAADFAQRFLDVFLGQARTPREILDDGAQPTSEVIEHAGASDWLVLGAGVGLRVRFISGPDYAIIGAR